MKVKDQAVQTREDRPGEAEKRARIRKLYGENQRVEGAYDERLAAPCRNGTFLGLEREGVIAYRGIPYAKPPVGERRWKSPEPAEADDRVYQAYYFGKTPIQTEWPSEEGSYYPQGEDCLTLNVWTSGNTGEKTVMVFFHGGSYGWGATSDPIYEGHCFVAAHPEIVLVTAEYRVGIMGFLDLSEVPGGEAFATSGNLGLLDHICALQWVQENISAFGGDPAQVTIFGESAGGGTVSLLPIMPQAKGLFRRSIAESGSVALTYSREECKGLTQRLLKETGAQTMEELMALTEQELMAANENLNDYNNFPERDGIVLPEDLYGAYERGDAADVDLLMGTNADEVCYWIREMGYYSKSWLGKTMFKLGIPVMFNSNLERFSEEDKARTEQFFRFFPGRKVWKIVEFYNDILFRVPALAQAEAQAKNGGKAYVYYWTYPSAHRHLGACHAVELAYVFNNLDVTIYTGDNIKPYLAREVQEMWVNFAKNGNPSTPTAHWNAYDLKKRETMVLGKAIFLEPDLLGKRREIVTPLLKYYLNGCYTNLSFHVPLIYKIMAAFAAVIGLVPAALLLLFHFARKGWKKLFPGKERV